MMKKRQGTIWDKIQLTINLFIRVSIFVALVTSIVNKNWEVVFLSALTLLLTFSPIIIEKSYRLYFTTELELVAVIFIYAGLFLGEVHGYFTLFWWWDVILHATSGIVLGLAGFLIMYILYYEQKIDASPFLIAVFSFSFALAIGTVWEMFEFIIDNLFSLNMQKSGLVDTMWDLIINSIGALIISTLGYFYIKGTKYRILEKIISRFIRENPKLLNRKPST